MSSSPARNVLSGLPRKRQWPVQALPPVCAPQTLAFTDHATRRSRMRSVPGELVPVVVEYGQRFRQSDGRVVYFVGKRQVAHAAVQAVDLTPALNVAVVIAHDGLVLTVVRTADPRRLKRIGFLSRRRFRAPARRLELA